MAITQPPKKPDESILIVTVTKMEAQAILETFFQALGKESALQVIEDKTYYDLGVCGDVQVFMVQSEMGTATPGGALLTIREAIQKLRPQAVIMCGIAFGLNQDKQRLGDILIAKQIQYYEFQKTDRQQGQIPRGDRVTTSDRLLDRFRTADNFWQKKNRTHFGLVLSGEKLVNDPDVRDSLLKKEPEAIGGEMEGAGLYAAADQAKVDWILVKSICDWGDGKKNSDVQPSAAQNAAQFVLHVLQLGGWEMPEPLRGNQKKARLERSLEIINKKLDALYNGMASETRFEEKVRLQNTINEEEQMRDQLEAEIDKLEE